MQIGFEVVAAQSKKARDTDDAPSRTPMRPAPTSIRRNPGSDQLKARKQMRRKTAAIEDLDLAALISEERDWSAKLNNARTPDSVDVINGYLDDVRAEIAKRQREGSVKTAGLSPEDAKFLYNHAKEYARGDDAYAAWYMATYAGDADSLEDVPDHPKAWDEYLKVKDDQPEDDPSEGADDDHDNPFAKKESRMTTEADLLAKMAAARTLPEQAEFGRQLAALRAERIQGQREAAALDLADTIVESRYPSLPVATTQIGVTASTDWLVAVEPDERPTPQVEATMRAEASVWYASRPEAVKADTDEIAAQTVGYGRRLASQFGLQAEAAYHAFVDAVDHLHTAATKRLALDEVQKPPYQAPVNDVQYPTNTDTFDDALSTPVADPKTGQDTPSLAEGDSPEGDQGPQVMNPAADNADHAADSKDTGATDYLDGTSTPNRQGGNETFSSLVRQAEGEGNLYPDRNASDRGSNTAPEQTPSLSEGDQPEGDQAPDTGANTLGTDHVNDGGNAPAKDGTQVLPDTPYPGRTSSLRSLAAAIEADEATVGRQVHPNARPFLAALHQVESINDSFAGVPGAQIVEHFLRQARLGGPNAKAHVEALNAHLRGEVETKAAAQSPAVARREAAQKEAGLADFLRHLADMISTHGYEESQVLASLKAVQAGEVPEAFKKNWKGHDSESGEDGDDEGGDSDNRTNSQADSDDDPDASESGDDDKKPWEKASAKTAADGQTCAVCGDSIERDPASEDPQTWHHNNGEKHDHEAKPSGGDSKESALASFAARVQANLRVSAAERCPATKKVGEDRYTRCTLDKGHDGECQFDSGKTTPPPV